MAKNNKNINIILMISGILIGFGGISLIYFNYIVPSGKSNFTDTHGRNVLVPDNPIRIISMAPSITEIIFALEAENKLVGVTDYCNYPEEAQNITSIGGFSTPDLENITALEPDLIIAATWDQDSVSTLENLNLAIVVIEPGNKILDIINSIKIIGELINVSSKADELIQNLKHHYWSITNKTASLEIGNKKTCYFEVWETPMVVAEDSFLNDMIDKAGLINIFDDLNGEYVDVSTEYIISEDPDIIFITEHSAAWYSQDISNRTGYDEITAIKNDTVYLLDDDLFLRASWRIVEALEYMSYLIYPSLYV